MIKRLSLFKRLALDLPRQARLAYCLMRDGRVPAYTKAAFGTALGVIVTPFIDLPAAIPFVGELDVLALSMLALRLFIAACPDDVVADIEQQILEKRSVFDADARSGERIATLISNRFTHNDTAAPAQAAPVRTAPRPASSGTRSSASAGSTSSDRPARRGVRA